MALFKLHILKYEKHDFVNTCSSNHWVDLNTLEEVFAYIQTIETEYASLRTSIYRAVIHVYELVDNKKVDLFSIGTDKTTHKTKHKAGYYVNAICFDVNSANYLKNRWCLFKTKNIAIQAIAELTQTQALPTNTTLYYSPKVVNGYKIAIDWD